MAISPINSNPILPIQDINTPVKPTASGNAGEVVKTFENMLSSLNESQLKSDSLVEQLSRGENVDLHTVMIGLEENNVNFNVALGIRDKLVEAYREVMRMQV